MRKMRLSLSLASAALLTALPPIQAKLDPRLTDQLLRHGRPQIGLFQTLLTQQAKDDSVPAPQVSSQQPFGAQPINTKHTVSLSFELISMSRTIPPFASDTGSMRQTTSRADQCSY